MKRFFLILCILILIPTLTFAAGSPTTRKLIKCKPAINFTLAEETRNWPTIVERLAEIEEIQDDIMFDAVYIFVKKYYKEIEWQLSVPVTEDQEPYVLILSNKNIIRQELEVNKEGNVIMDMTTIGVGFYYLCFYVKGA